MRRCLLYYLVFYSMRFDGECNLPSPPPPVASTLPFLSQQLHRVLKDGGVAVVAAWDKDPNSIALKMFRVMSTLNGGPS